MNTQNAKGQCIESSKEFWDNGKVGDWSFYFSDDEIAGMFVRTPNGTPEGSIDALPFNPNQDDHDWWQWNGNKEAPTLTPSILNRRTGWHGFMTNGELISV